VEGIKTELSWGVELGYAVKYSRWAANLNLYRTTWENRPVKYSLPGGTPTTINIPNLGSVHQGVELDAIYRTPWFFDVEGLISYGDWRWKGVGYAYYYEDGSDIPTDADTVDADGVRVGDAAQFQVSGSVKIKPTKDVYIKGQITYFDNYFSEFNPLNLQGENSGRDSWKIPAYYLFDLHAGWTIKLKKMDLSLRASILNVLNTTYISDAQNNSLDVTFDATAATVFVGQGRRWTATVGIKF
jgi:iron complex outermembrane receptor protein